MTTVLQMDRSLNPDPILYFYEIDFSTALAPLNLTLYLSPYRNGTSNISFGGQTYTHAPIDLQGIITEAGGKLMQPVLSYLGKPGDVLLLQAIASDIRGTTVVRKRTYRRFLDDGSEPSGSQFQETRFHVNGLESRRKNLIRLRLTPAYGIEGINDLSNRTLAPDSCALKYRVWDAETSSFKYTPHEDGGCPWGNPAEAANYPKVTSGFGTPYFNTSDETVAEASQDRCSKHASGCIARFMKDAPNDPDAHIPIEAQLASVGGQC